MICFFSCGENECSAPSGRRRQRSPGLLHLDGFNSHAAIKKNLIHKDEVLIWRSERDLNPRAAFDGLLP